LEKWLILGLGQETYKMSLECFVVPESKKLHPLPHPHKTNKLTVDEYMSEGCRNLLKELLNGIT